MSAVATPTQSNSPTLTVEEFARRCHGQRAELVKGQVKELPMPFPKPGKICMTIGYLILDHAMKNDLGHVMSNDSFVKTRSNPDTVRGADVSYYSYERLPKGEVPEELLAAVPDLVVEVRSPSDNWSEIFTKVGEYLAAGVRAGIVLDAKTKSASEYREEEFQQTYHNGDELTVPIVLPDFAVPVGRLFE